MLEKLKSRHELDVPVRGWQRSRGLLTTIGLLVLLFVIAPALGAVLAGLLRAPFAVVLGVASGVVLLLFASVAYRRYRATA